MQFILVIFTALFVSLVSCVSDSNENGMEIQETPSLLNSKKRSRNQFSSESSSDVDQESKSLLDVFLKNE